MRDRQTDRQTEGAERKKERERRRRDRDRQKEIGERER